MLKENKDQILKDLIDAQGKPVDIGGYYEPNEEMTKKPCVLVTS